MSYAIIQPPFTLKFREMPKKELKAYFSWFLDQIPKRTAELERIVKVESIFIDWSADKSPQSLLPLGEWFAGQIEIRSLTSEEIKKSRVAATIPIEIPDYELTNRTFSLAMDIGMYFGEIFRAQYPHLKWEQPLDDNRFVDYGQPVLVGFGPVPLNPVAILVTLAYAIADKKQNGKRLRDIYSYWEKQASDQAKKLKGAKQKGSC